MNIDKLREIKETVDEYKRIKGAYDDYMNEKTKRGELVYYNHPMQDDMDRVNRIVGSKAVEWLSELLTEVAFTRIGIPPPATPSGERDNE